MVLPVGLQLMGNYFDEARMLDVAHAYQQVTDWHHADARRNLNNGMGSRYWVRNPHPIKNQH